MICSFRAATALSLLAAFAPAGCAGDDELRPLDDDDAVADDDDEPHPFAKVTFAAGLQGGPDAESPDRSWVEGTFHFLYWEDEDDAMPSCRVRLDLAGEARIERDGDDAERDDSDDDCPGCVGGLDLEPVGAPEGDDACSELPAQADLSFLFEADSGARPGDFSRTEIVSLAALEGGSYPLGREGSSTDGLLRSYAAAGFRAEALVLVQGRGWFGEEAGLAEIASPWGSQKLLPMLVAYRDAGAPASPMLQGDFFLAGLWALELGAGNPDPPPDGAR